MENKVFTVAILGVGSRGGGAYGRLMSQMSEQYKVVSLCDLKNERLSRYGDKFGVAPENRFLNEVDFFKEKRADLLVVATQDADHVRHTIRGFELGYDVLLEKPITYTREECEKILDAQKKYNKQAFVCHVLRYSPLFVKAKELLEKGAIGRLVAINALERVAYWHQAHSFVRGNWRTTKETAPMILAKCCHDLDLLQYYAGAKCVSVSSVGDLSFFNKENAPENASEWCVDCPHASTCPYDAKRYYVDEWEKRGCPEDSWPHNVIADAPLNKEKLLEAVETGPYGRCVFHCDNNVVDHQITQMTFENGVKASLTMTAFTHGINRRINFFGTHGELLLDDEKLTLKVFGKEPETISLDEKDLTGFGHGGGDYGLVLTLYNVLLGKGSAATSLTASIESHLMGICAEESRLKGGQLVYIHT